MKSLSTPQNALTLDSNKEPVRYFGQGQTPHRCPICYGKGIVQRGFYHNVGYEWSTSDASPEQCRACGGNGILWR